MLPCIFYIGMLILLLYYPAHSLRVTVSIKKEASIIHALLTSYNTTHFIYFAASQTIFLFLNITSVFPPSLYIPPDSNIYQLHE